MTGRLLLAAAGLILMIVLGIGGRAFILAITHPGRHELREQAGEAEADEFVAELRGLPAPGLDIYTDRNVWLPWTPPLERMASDTDIRTIQQPEPGPPIVATITDVPARRPAPTDDLESTFIRALLAAGADPDRIDAVFAGDR